MAISFKFPDLEWGQTWYIKNDPYQEAHALVGVISLPGKQTKFILSSCGVEVILYDFECSLERNPELGEIPKNDDEEEDD